MHTQTHAHTDTLRHTHTHAYTQHTHTHKSNLPARTSTNPGDYASSLPRYQATPDTQ